MIKLEQIGSNQSFGGQQLRYKHQSAVLNCEMTFSIYLPPQAEQGQCLCCIGYLA